MGSCRRSPPFDLPGAFSSMCSQGGLLILREWEICGLFYLGRTPALPLIVYCYLEHQPTENNSTVCPRSPSILPQDQTVMTLFNRAEEVSWNQEAEHTLKYSNHPQVSVHNVILTLCFHFGELQRSYGLELLNFLQWAGHGSLCYRCFIFWGLSLHGFSATRFCC